MRKAFEKNVPRRRPRLRRAAAVEGLAPGAPGAAQPLALVSRLAAPPPPPRAAIVAAGWRERLEKIKRRMAESAPPAPRVELVKIRHRAVRPGLPVGSLPAVPTRAPDNVLSLVEALRGELARSRQREEALRGELHAARGELARAVGEARGAAERLAAAYADYVLQVAVRQRTQFSPASSHGRPAAVPSGVSRGTAEREAKQPSVDRSAKGPPQPARVEPVVASVPPRGVPRRGGAGTLVRSGAGNAPVTQGGTMILGAETGRTGARSGVSFQQGHVSRGARLEP